MIKRGFNIWRIGIAFLIIGLFSNLSFGSDDIIKDDNELTIIESLQTLEFYLKKGNLQAKLSVSRVYESLTNKTTQAASTVFFDNSSKVEKIRRDGKKKILPIIADYNSDGIFHSDLKVCHFVYPLENKGDQVELSYQKIFKDVKFLDPLYFVDIHDIVYSEITVIVPKWLKLNKVQWNFDGYELDVSEEAEKKSTVYHYTQENVVALSREGNAPSRSKIYPHIIPIVQSYTNDGEVTNLMNDVSDLYRWYSSLVKEIENDNKELQELVSKILEGEVSDQDKVSKLFYWVQDNIRYVAFEYGIMGFKPEACQYVYYDKFGDCKGMANLLKEMLIIAGFDARLSWIGTNDLPYDYSIPSLIVDNHMICTAVVNGKDIFLDPTEKHSDLYNYGNRIEGRPILIEEGESFRIEKVPVGIKPDEEIRNQKLTIEGEKLSGTGTLSFSGDRKTRILSYLSTFYKEDKVDFVKNYIRKGDKNIVLSLDKELSDQTREIDYLVDYNINMNNRIVNLGGEIYFHPEVDYPFKNAEIKKERVSPVEISDQGKDLNDTTIQIPEGWNVSYIPKSVVVKTENYNIEMYFEKTGNLINYHREIEILNSVIYPKDFSFWNETAISINEFYSDQIILVKK